MDCVSLWSSDSEDESGITPERIQRKIIRDSSDIMMLSDKNFVKNFRLNKEAFMCVLNNIKDDLKPAERSTAISPLLKLAATLKFLAQGGYQHQIGQDRLLGFSQSSVSLYMSEVCQAIEKNICPKTIVLQMTEEKMIEAKRSFLGKCGIPGVIGAVDGTHIQIIRPVEDEHLFFNRKLKHSINAMVICDHEMYIRAVDGRFGGASHDSHVWNLSQERIFFKENYLSGGTGTRLLGDSGYPLEPWLLTPYKNSTENSPESFFNEQHSKGRSIIERTFGLLKARFRCLLAARELHYAPKKAVTILNVCCALHNICVQFNVDLPPVDLNETINYSTNSSAETETNFSDIAKNIRDEIKNNMLRNL